MKQFNSTTRRVALERAVLSLRSMARHVPAALLATVALVQIALASSLHLSAWKGGGFGMFSTLDHGGFRGIDIVVDAPGRSEHVEIAPSLQVEAARATALPADWLLRRLAEGIAARERRYARPVSRVTLSVWFADFDRTTLRGSERAMRSFVYDVPAESGSTPRELPPR